MKPSFSFNDALALYVAPGIVAARQLLDGVAAAGPIVEDAPPADTLQLL